MNNFWTKTWREDKVLTCFFVFFVLGQVFFTYKGVETFPFQNYGMYSEPIAQLGELTVLYLSWDSLGTETLKYSSFIRYQLSYYEKWKQAGFVSSEAQLVRNRFSEVLNQECLSFLTSKLSNGSELKVDWNNWLLNYFKEKELYLIRKKYEYIPQKGFELISTHVEAFR